MKTIKRIGVLILILSVTACGQKAEKKTETPEGWSSLSENDYVIDYADTWQLDTSGQMNTNFILFSPLSSEQDPFKENVNLITQNLTGLNIDLDKFVEISENQIKTMITDGKIIESKRITTKNLEHQKVIYTGKQGVSNLKFEQYYWVANNKAFILTLTCEETQFDDYQVTGEKIMNSFYLN